MLAYSLSFNKHISVPPLVKILQAKIVELIWNAINFMPENPRNASELMYWDFMLTRHCVQTISASNNFIDRSILPPFLKTRFKENVYSLCRANSQVLEWKNMYDRNNELGDLNTHLLDAPNYFTVDGEFDDLAWTKHMVLDPNHQVVSRFLLACYYCLENETVMLWSELKSKEQYFIVDLSDIQSRMPLIITFWIFHLENQMEALTQDPQYAGNFYESVFQEAVKYDYEYATRYFWEKIAEQENIMENESFFHLIYDSKEKNCVFLHSKLPKEQKQRFLDWSIKNGIPFEWIILLLSPYTESERSEIIGFVFKLPIDQYLYVLSQIEEGRYKHSLPFYREEVFKLLWTRLAPEDQRNFRRLHPLLNY